MRLKKFIQMLGPGLIYAGAAVGVSHLVQSTRAGAGFGFDLIWVLLIANIIKYPFFEFAPRYASTTGQSLIEGYQKLGRWAIVAFSLLTLLTMFTIQAAVTIVTAGLVAYVFHLEINVVLLSAIILGACSIVLVIGKYSALDKAIKLIIVLLALSTIIAVISALDSGPKTHFFPTFDWLNKAHVFFLIAFIGWMPSPIDVSVWSSLWTVAKSRELSNKPSLRQSLLDFKIGYIGTTLLAVAFLSLGALIMHGSGEELSPQGVVFAGQFITMYTISIGEWAYYLIAIAAVTTMVSTTLTCLDAYPRVLQPITEILVPSLKNNRVISKYQSPIWLIILIFGTLLLLSYLSESMHVMVDIATTLSFVTAPILAYMNLKVVADKHMPSHGQPSKWMQVFAWIGILFLGAFTIFFLYYRFFV